jgi:hypothetical protein
LQSASRCRPWPGEGGQPWRRCPAPPNARAFGSTNGDPPAQLGGHRGARRGPVGALRDWRWDPHGAPPDEARRCRPALGGRHLVLGEHVDGDRQLRDLPASRSRRPAGRRVHHRGGGWRCRCRQPPTPQDLCAGAAVDVHSSSLHNGGTGSTSPRRSPAAT